MKKKEVFVGFSGGVDSFAAAFLLKEVGYHVTAVHLILHDPSPQKTEKQLHALAESLGIPLITKDLRNRFRDTIITPFAKSYLSGKTPNPCVWCNEQIKLRALSELAGEHGVPWIATGHYARKELDEKQQCWIIKRGRDKKKDQSYFLSFVSQEHLKKLLLPLGDQIKAELVSKIKKGNHPVGERSESHDICFLQGTSFAEFITAWAKASKGEGTFVNKSGKILGTHDGFHRFTIGQRRGIGIADRTPYYVTALFPERNQVQIGKEADLYKSTFRVTGCHWHLPPEGNDISVLCQIRYRHKAAPATLRVLDSNKAEVSFEEPQRAITPGQVAAFYREDLLIGAGTIDTVLK